MDSRPPRERDESRRQLTRCAVVTMLSIAPTLTALAALTGSRPLGLLAGRIASLVLPIGIVLAAALAVTAPPDGGGHPRPPDGETREHAKGE